MGETTMNDRTAQAPSYDIKSVKLPYLSGAALRLFAALLESPLGGLLIPGLFRSSGISWLREQRFDDPPARQPIRFPGAPAAAPLSVPEKEWPRRPASPGPGFRFASVQDYAEAYRTGKITPEDVARKVLEAIEAGNASDPPLRAIIACNRDDVLRQAGEASKRIESGQALSVFDGVPVAGKDEGDSTR